MTSDDIRSRFLAFFKRRHHTVIPSASLVPNEEVGAVASSQTLFTTAGMQPFIPYLLGKPHPAGRRLVDCQKCVRTGDIDDVGDNRHLTFFEMLGNWSLGDYFKKEAIEWSFEFLTSKKNEPGEQGLGLDPNRLYVTVFKGEQGIPRDEEAITLWQEVFKRAGLSNGVAGDDEMLDGNTADNGVRIIPLGVADNFWIAGTTGPCGGDTEMFYDTKPELGPTTGKFADLVNSFRFIEVWNDVFMEFNKTADGRYEKLASKNVDTGMGLERTTAVVNNKSTVFETDSFLAILEQIRMHAKIKNEKSERIIADHIRTAVFMIADGVTPSNTDRGYILRRLLRRSIRHADSIQMTESLSRTAETVQKKYQNIYPNVTGNDNGHTIQKTIQDEELKFGEAVKSGLREFEKLAKEGKNISASQAFQLFSSYGLPIEVIVELAREKGLNVETDGFEEESKKHQDLSRVGAEKKFKGGLGDTSEMSVKYHTATHVLNAALKQVLGPHVGQKGSNITPERLRFDFSHSEKMTDAQKQEVERIVNEKIADGLPVTMEEMPKAEAEKIATHAFNEKYGDMVKVYSIGDKQRGYFSREFCGGPHVSNTKELAGPEETWRFKILKEEAVSAGVRRIKAVLTK